MKALRMTIQLKAVEQFFPTVPLYYAVKGASTFSVWERNPQV